MSFSNKTIILIFCMLLTFLEAPYAQRLLKYRRVQQKQDQWCWAACSQWILAYHNIFPDGYKDDFKAQERIAKYGWVDGRPHNMWNWIYTSSENGRNVNGNVGNGRGINWILPHFGVPVINKQGCHYTFSESHYKKSIEEGHPFVVRWQWSNGGGHFVVAMAYLEGGVTWIMNPWKDDGIQIHDYDWVKRAGRHTWDYTLETKKIDTLPELTAEFPAKVEAGKEYSVKLTAKTQANEDVSSLVYFNKVTQSVTIGDSSATGWTLKWTPKEGDKFIEFEMNYGNARDTIKKEFDITGIHNPNAPTVNAYKNVVHKLGNTYVIEINIPEKNNSKNSLVSLFTLSGKKVLSRSLQGRGTHTIHLNSKVITSGMYILSITNNQLKTNSRLIF